LSLAASGRLASAMVRKERRSRLAPLSAFMRLQISQHHPGDVLASLRADIMEAKEVKLCFEVAGEYDFVALVSVRDMPSYNRFIDRLLIANPLVTRYETIFIKREIKGLQPFETLADLAAHDADDDDSPIYAESFWVNHVNGVIRVPVSSITRITAEGDYMRIHDGDRSWLIHSTITRLIDQLDPREFIRLHRSAIVRRDRIVSLEHDEGQHWVVCLADGARQRVARSHVADALKIAGKRRDMKLEGEVPPERSTGRPLH
jgi:hypothetical protein